MTSTRLFAEPCDRLFPQRGPRTGLGPGAAADGMGLGDGDDLRTAVRLLQEAMRTQAAELEMEREAREAAVREVSLRNNAEIRDLRLKIKQLQAESIQQRETIYALEQRRQPLPQYQDPTAAYWSTSTSSGAMLGHSGPLIPRMFEAESEIERLKSLMDKFKGLVRTQEERTLKLSSELGQIREIASDAARESARAEVERRDVTRDAAMQSHAETLMTIRNDMNEAHNRSISLQKREVEKLAQAIRDLREDVDSLRADRRGSELDEMKSLISVTMEKDRRELEDIIARQRADLMTALRKAEGDQLDQYERLQEHITHVTETVRCGCVPRDEYQRFQTQTLSSLTRDVEVAQRAALTAKATVDDALREMRQRVAGAESSVESLRGEVERHGPWREQVGKSLQEHSKAIEDAQDAIRQIRSAVNDVQSRQQNISTRYNELSTSIDDVSTSVRLTRSTMESSIIKDATERQSLRDRTAAVETTMTELQRRLRALEEGQERLQATAQKSLEREIIAMPSEVSEETLRRVQTIADGALRKTQELDARLVHLEETVDNNREECVCLMQSRVESLKQQVQTRAAEQAEASRASIEEVRELAAAASKIGSDARTALASLTSRYATIEHCDGSATAAAEALTELQARLEKRVKEATTGIEAIRRDMAGLATNEEIVTMRAEINAQISQRVTAQHIIMLEQRIGTVEGTAASLIASAAAGAVPASAPDNVVPPAAVAELETKIAKQGEEMGALAEFVQELASTVAVSATAVDRERIEGMENGLVLLQDQIVSLANQAATYSEALRPDAPPPRTLEDVIVLLLQMTGEAIDNREGPALREALQQLAVLVERHEGIVSRFDELVQAIMFNNQNIVHIGGLVGVPQDKLTLGLALEELDTLSGAPIMGTSMEETPIQPATPGAPGLASRKAAVGEIPPIYPQSNTSTSADNDPPSQALENEHDFEDEQAKSPDLRGEDVDDASEDSENQRAEF